MCLRHFSKKEFQHKAMLALHVVDRQGQTGQNLERGLQV